MISRSFLKKISCTSSSILMRPSVGYVPSMGHKIKARNTTKM